MDKNCQMEFLLFLMTCSKPQEDSYMYQYWAMILASKYALLDKCNEFFDEGGPLEKFVDLEIASTKQQG